MKVRVRFAPSPTGPLHIGGVRTALYNYLFAKKNGGDLLLRIEDTDQGRFVPGAEEYIIESFRWLGIKFDEGVGIGGAHAPYRQSERKELYRKYADELIDKGFAYYAFDSAADLEAKRKECEAVKKTFQYDVNSRMQMCNSLTLSKEEVEKRINGGEQYVIRFKYPENVDVVVDDLIRGLVKINTSLLDDKVLYKSDGMPTYHLANVVDDHLMEITHVIRGEEWLPSVPLHAMLYKAFGWEAPRFAHLPLLLKPDGNGKLSKRDGDRLGFPVFPLEWHDPKSGEISSGYREKGYLPEAVINFLALLGWNSGTEQEFFTLDELVERFSIEKISKSGAKFDLEKAKWFNHHYIQLLPDEKLAEQLLPVLAEKNIELPFEKVVSGVAMIKERVHFTTELWEQCHYLFEAPKSYDEQAIKKRWKPGTPKHLTEIAKFIDEANSIEQMHDLVMNYIQSNELNMGQIMNSFRLALVGETKGPDLFTLISFLGVKETKNRMFKAIDVIGERE